MITLNETLSQELRTQAIREKESGNIGKYYGLMRASKSLLFIPLLTEIDVINGNINAPWIGEGVKERLANLIKHKEIVKELAPKSTNKHKHYQLREIIVPKVEKLIKDLNIDAEIVGSYRRECTYVGDVDLLVKNKLPNLSRYNVLASGDKKAKIKLDDFEVDFRLVEDEESYPFTLLYFTGSAETNIYLRAAAKRMKLKLNEYGLFEISTDKRIILKSEKEIFEYLGFPYREPKDR